MDIQQILRWIVVAIVLLVAMSLLGVILKVGAVLVQIALKLLVFLFIVAVILRLFGMLRKK